MIERTRREKEENNKGSPADLLQKARRIPEEMTNRVGERKHGKGEDLGRAQRSNDGQSRRDHGGPESGNETKEDSDAESAEDRRGSGL